MHILHVVGARPNFMKIAPIVDAIREAEARGGFLRFRLIHTDQHYDRAMSMKKKPCGQCWGRSRKGHGDVR